MANFKYSHLYSTSATTAPAAALLLDGEIALNIKKDSEAIYFKNNQDEVVELKVGNYYTKDEADAEFATKEELGDLADAVSALTDTVDGIDERVETIENKDFVEYTPYGERKTIQLRNYDSISGVMTATPANGGFDGEATGVNLVMVSKWNVADFGSTKLPINLNGFKARPTYNDDKEIALLEDLTAATESARTYADATFFADAKYEDSGSTKVINFYAVSGETPLATIDATAFIKDGMVTNVAITGGTGDNEGKDVLKVTFNTDAGKENIEIPLADIFNPDNYYTKSEVSGFVESLETKITTVSGDVITEHNRAVSAETQLATAIENAKKVAITAATADYAANVLKLTLTNGENTAVTVDMKVTDAGNGILLNSAKVDDTIILSGGTF